MEADRFTLIIGDKNTSSWSMRPWLLMHHAGIEFDEINVKLHQPERRKNILAHSPSGKVPALKWNDSLIWDSLAVSELIAELRPDLALWPADRAKRALARSAAAEMHSGFAAVRKTLPMDCLSTIDCPPLDDTVVEEIARIVAVWKTCRAEAGDGPYLFGSFGVVDAMYAPVASRFKTYSIDLTAFGDDEGEAAACCTAILDHPSVKAWFSGAEQEMAESA